MAASEKSHLDGRARYGMGLDRLCWYEYLTTSHIHCSAHHEKQAYSMVSYLVFLSSHALSSPHVLLQRTQYICFSPS